MGGPVVRRPVGYFFRPVKQLDNDIWIADTPLRVMGMELGARMTVIRLPGSKLLLHSPVQPSPRLVRELDALGEVAWLIAPNRFHHMYVQLWKDACPDAEIHVAPTLERKRSDLEVTGILTDIPNPGWAETVDQVVVQGIPMTREVVFFHRPSATLILTDLAFNIGDSSPRMTRAAFRMAGSYGRLAPTAFERLLVRDRDAFRASMERVLDWPFGRVVVTHGNVCESGGRDALIDGYAWLAG